MLKIPNLKFVVLLEYQNIKIFLQNVAFQIGLKKFSVIKRIKNSVPWTYDINDLKGEEIVGKFYEKRIAKNK